MMDFTNLLQSWEYGEAKTKCGFYVKRFVINIDEEIEGLFQIWYKKILGYPVLRLNRGILLKKSLVKNDVFLENYLKIYKEVMIKLKELSKIVFTNFEVNHEQKWCNKLCNNTLFCNKSNYNYASFYLNLYDFTEERLFKNLKSKWRNLLRKSWKYDNKIIEISNGKEIEEIIKIYDSFQKEKGFKGIDKNFLKILLAEIKYKIYAIKKDDDYYIGFIIVTLHGDSANYLIGYSNDVGRKELVNYNLLWHSIIESKKEGIKYFDLGGVSEKKDSIRHFKEGLNGMFYNLCKIKMVIL